MSRDAPEDLRVVYFSVGTRRYALLSYQAPPPRFPFGLTESEWLVALLMVAGYSSEDIASTRRVSVRTVANQSRAIFRKVGVRSRRELIASWTDRLAALTDASLSSSGNLTAEDEPPEEA